MTRIELFNSFADHPMQQRLMKRLTKEEMALCVEFITTNSELDRNEFTMKVNRWFLNSSERPKHHVDMWALVSQTA